MAKKVNEETLVDVEVKEVNKIKGYQSFLMCLGTIFIILIGFKVVNLIKRFIKLKNNL